MNYKKAFLLFGAILIHSLINTHDAEKTYKSAIIFVDPQRDFCVKSTLNDEAGSLAVEGTDEDFIINKIYLLSNAVRKSGFLIVATQDFHPANHSSFASNNLGTQTFEAIEKTITKNDESIEIIKQVMWPDHCIQGTKGAELIVHHAIFDHIIQKGKNSKFDSYSGFKDQGGEKTELENILRKYDIDSVIICGIATDYCVEATAKDSLEAGFKTTVLLDACRGVDPKTSLQALENLAKLGAVIAHSSNINFAQQQ